MNPAGQGEENNQLEERRRRFDDLQIILQGLNFSDIAWKEIGYGYGNEWHNNIPAPDYISLNFWKMNNDLNSHNVFLFKDIREYIKSNNIYPSLNNVINLIPPINIADINLVNPHEAVEDYNNFFSQYFHAVAFNHMYFKPNRNIGSLMLSKGPLSGIINYGYVEKIQSKDVYILIDEVAKQNSAKLKWLAHFFLTQQLYRIRLHHFLPRELYAQGWTGEGMRKESDLSPHQALKKITKYLNYAIYASRKLYQLDKENFKNTENNPGIHQENLFNIFGTILSPHNVMSISQILTNQIKYYNKDEEFSGEYYKQQEINALRDKFFSIVEEGSKRHFVRQHPWWSFLGGAGISLAIISFLYKNNLLPESWKNYIDKKIGTI